MSIVAEVANIPRIHDCQFELLPPGVQLFTDVDPVTKRDLSQPYPPNELAPVGGIAPETLAARAVRASWGRACIAVAHQADPRLCPAYGALVEQYVQVQTDMAVSKMVSVTTAHEVTGGPSDYFLGP